MRDYLRKLPVFAGVIGEFDVDDLPDEPTTLFVQWLHNAADDGVPEPHAMTLSTTDGQGAPDARVLILKDLDDAGWWFASSAESAKGLQLDHNPSAALTFYWPQLARQVRVRGRVITGTPEQSAADFRSRATGARAVAVASHESQPLADRATCAAAVRQADPDQISPSWRVYAVDAHTVEFWQADKDRLHTRVQYRRTNNTWTHGLLWP